MSRFEVFKDLIEFSQNETRGLTIYIGGQMIAGLVTEVIGTEAIEIRSQMISKGVILIDSIDAITLS